MMTILLIPFQQFVPSLTTFGRLAVGSEASPVVSVPARGGRSKVADQEGKTKFLLDTPENLRSERRGGVILGVASRCGSFG